MFTITYNLDDIRPKVMILTPEQKLRRWEHLKLMFLMFRNKEFGDFTKCKEGDWAIRYHKLHDGEEQYDLVFVKSLHLQGDSNGPMAIITLDTGEHSEDAPCRISLAAENMALIPSWKVMSLINKALIAS